MEPDFRALFFVHYYVKGAVAPFAAIGVANTRLPPVRGFAPQRPGSLLNAMPEQREANIGAVGVETLMTDRTPEL